MWIPLSDCISCSFFSDSNRRSANVWPCCVEEGAETSSIIQFLTIFFFEQIFKTEWDRVDFYQKLGHTEIKYRVDVGLSCAHAHSTEYHAMNGIFVFVTISLVRRLRYYWWKMSWCTQRSNECKNNEEIMSKGFSAKYWLQIRIIINRLEKKINDNSWWTHVISMQSSTAKCR